jgi:hypothetical protein
MIEQNARYSAFVPYFGLWCSLGLELLARAAVASVSPTLLAEPDKKHENLLRVLGVGSGTSAPRSIPSSQVFLFCQDLFANLFSAEDYKAATALLNRRNAELHSAEAAFDIYPSAQWLPGFYHCCSSLVAALGESLENLLGNEQAVVASEVLQQLQEGVLGQVKATIAAHKKVFAGKTSAERDTAAATARLLVAVQVTERHHKVSCPACNSDATVEGIPFGPEKVSHEEGDIVVRQSVSPRMFSCSACGLSLTGYAQLGAADLGGIYTRRTTYSPEDYYGLIDPDSADMTKYVEQYLQDRDEYDNE